MVIFLGFPVFVGTYMRACGWVPRKQESARGPDFK